MDVSENSGTPKSSILIGFSIIFTIHFGGFPPIFGNTHIVPPVWLHSLHRCWKSYRSRNPAGIRWRSLPTMAQLQWRCSRQLWLEDLKHWWFRNPGDHQNQLRPVVDLPFFTVFLDIPGGDRRISEPSKVLYETINGWPWVGLWPEKRYRRKTRHPLQTSAFLAIPERLCQDFSVMVMGQGSLNHMASWSDGTR